MLQDDIGPFYERESYSLEYVYNDLRTKLQKKFPNDSHEIIDKVIKLYIPETTDPSKFGSQRGYNTFDTTQKELNNTY